MPLIVRKRDLGGIAGNGHIDFHCEGYRINIKSLCANFTTELNGSAANKIISCAILSNSGSVLIGETKLIETKNDVSSTVHYYINFSNLYNVNLSKSGNLTLSYDYDDADQEISTVEVTLDYETI